MSKPTRKTVNRTMIVTIANDAIAAAPTVAEREAIAVVVSTILMRGDSYLGFSYLPSEYLPAEEQTIGNVLRDGYDDSKRRYF